VGAAVSMDACSPSCGIDVGDILVPEAHSSEVFSKAYASSDAGPERLAARVFRDARAARGTLHGTVPIVGSGAFRALQAGVIAQRQEVQEGRVSCRS